MMIYDASDDGDDDGDGDDDDHGDVGGEDDDDVFLMLWLIYLEASLKSLLQGFVGTQAYRL